MCACLGDVLYVSLTRCGLDSEGVSGTLKDMGQGLLTKFVCCSYEDCVTLKEVSLGL